MRTMLKYTFTSLAVCVESAGESMFCIIYSLNIRWDCMGWTIRISLLPFWFFCRFLAGCRLVTAGTGNRKEPQGLSELVLIQRYMMSYEEVG